MPEPADVGDEPAPSGGADEAGMEPASILLVEDNPGDVKLTKKAFEKAALANHIDVAADGVEAMTYLRDDGRDRPDIVLLDLKLPRMSGHEVLEEIKSDPDLRRIPVVILTSSESERDIVDSYDDHANAYLTKPVTFDGFRDVVERIEGFWFCVATLPPR